jgi:hypothetical protein
MLYFEIFLRALFFLAGSCFLCMPALLQQFGSALHITAGKRYAPFGRSAFVILAYAALRQAQGTATVKTSQTTGTLGAITI